MRKILSILLLLSASCFGQLQTNKVNNTAGIYNTNSVNVYNWKNIYTGNTFINATNFLFRESSGTFQSDRNGTNLYFKGSFKIFPLDDGGNRGYLFPRGTGFTIVGSTNDINNGIIGDFTWCSLANTNGPSAGEGRIAAIRGSLSGTAARDRGGQIIFSVATNAGVGTGPYAKMTLNDIGELRGSTDFGNLPMLTNWNAKFLSLKMLSEINMSGFKITNMLAGTSALDAVNFAQLQAATGGVFIAGVAFTASNNIFTAVNTFQGVTTNTGRLVATDGVLFTGTVTNGSLVVTNTVLAVGNITGNGIDNTLPNQTSTGSGSILTRSLGDGRYGQLAASQIWSNGVDTISVTNDFRGRISFGTNVNQQSVLGQNGFVAIGISNPAPSSTFALVLRNNNLIQCITSSGSTTNTLTAAAAYLTWTGQMQLLGAANFPSYTLGPFFTVGTGLADTVGSIGLFANTGTSSARWKTNGLMSFGTTNISLTSMTAGRVPADFYGYWSTNAVVNFGNILAAASEDVVIGFTGARATDVISLGMPTAQTNSLNVYGFVSSSDNITVRAQNVGALAVDQDSLTYKIVIMRFP